MAQTEPVAAALMRIANSTDIDRVVNNTFQNLDPSAGNRAVYNVFVAANGSLDGVEHLHNMGIRRDVVKELTVAQKEELVRILIKVDDIRANYDYIRNILRAELEQFQQTEAEAEAKRRQEAEAEAKRRQEAEAEAHTVSGLAAYDGIFHNIQLSDYDPIPRLVYVLGYWFHKRYGISILQVTSTESALPENWPIPSKGGDLDNAQALRIALQDALKSQLLLTILNLPTPQALHTFLRDKALPPSWQVDMSSVLPQPHEARQQLRILPWIAVAVAAASTGAAAYFKSVSSTSASVTPARVNLGISIGSQQLSGSIWAQLAKGNLTAATVQALQSYGANDLLQGQLTVPALLAERNHMCPVYGMPAADVGNLVRALFGAMQPTMNPENIQQIFGGRPVYEMELQAAQYALSQVMQAVDKGLFTLLELQSFLGSYMGLLDMHSQDSILHRLAGSSTEAAAWFQQTEQGSLQLSETGQELTQQLLRGYDRVSAAVQHQLNEQASTSIVTGEAYGPTLRIDYLQLKAKPDAPAIARGYSTNARHLQATQLTPDQLPGQDSFFQTLLPEPASTTAHWVWDEAAEAELKARAQFAYELVSQTIGGIYQNSRQGKILALMDAVDSFEQLYRNFGMLDLARLQCINALAAELGEKSARYVFSLLMTSSRIPSVPGETLLSRIATTWTFKDFRELIAHGAAHSVQLSVEEGQIWAGIPTVRAQDAAVDLSAGRLLLRKDLDIGNALHMLEMGMANPVVRTHTRDLYRQLQHYDAQRTRTVRLQTAFTESVAALLRIPERKHDDGSSSALFSAVGMGSAEPQYMTTSAILTELIWSLAKLEPGITKQDVYNSTLHHYIAGDMLHVRVKRDAALNELTLLE